MSSNGYAVYKTATQSAATDPRDIEYRLLAQVTAAMIKARETADSDFKAVVEAVSWNRDVWAALRQDLMADTNALPKDLRASLVSVSLWIERETSAVMNKEGDIDAMIDINRNIMAGLKPEHAHEDAPTQAS